MKQHEGVCPFTSIIKEQIAKARSLGIKCVSLVDINFDSFSWAKLYQQQIISHLHVVKEKIYNFPEKSELPKFILPVKINWLILLCGFWGGNKKFAEIRAGSLSRLTALPLNFALVATPCTLVLQHEPACRLANFWQTDLFWHEKHRCVIVFVDFRFVFEK